LFLIHSASSTCSGRLVVNDEEVIQVAPPSLAGQVGVVRCGDQAHRLGGSGVEVTEVVRSLLDLIGLQMVLVVHDRVVRRLDVAL